jgi:formylglycine-generating enzyme required for sulfatase activity
MWSELHELTNADPVCGIIRRMSRARAGIVLLLGSACGRIGFDELDELDDDADTLPAAPSCATLVPTCGPAGASTCCDSPRVPGGTFYRSYDGVGYDSTNDPATVGPFRLDKYEVTVARFRAFVDAGMGTRATAPVPGAGGRFLNGTSGVAGWEATWDMGLPIDTAGLRAALSCSAQFATWTDAPGNNENRPINCVDWSLAIAFCIWDGGFLPTEAEWNFAASGGDEQRAYPWSVPPGALVLDPTYASYAPSFDTDCVGDGMPGCVLTDIIPVGARPAGDARWGHADLAGNLYEWVLDWYEDVYPNPCVDCVSLTSMLSLRAYRGGSFRYAASGLRNGYRNAWTADDRSGFRCARSP